MKILYLAHRMPYPPDKGDKMRAYRHLAHLCSNHEVWCACFADTPNDELYAEALGALCRNVTVVRLNRRKALMRGALRLMRGGTITEGFYDHPQMRRAIDDLTRRHAFDVVVAFSSSMAPYALGVPARRRVLDMCDLDSAKWQDYAHHTGGPMRRVYRLEGRRLAVRERDWVYQFDATTVITRAEAQDLQTVAPDAPIFVVTNGVDMAHQGALDPARSMHNSSVDVRPLTIGFVGVMDYKPNVEGVVAFVDECWWDVRSAFPTAEFRIVGRRPTRAVRQLARVPGVTVVGEVADVAQELRSFDVSIAPLTIDRGLQNKILEAMAYGVPVIASEKAARGIKARDGREWLVAGDPDRMIRHIGRLLKDHDERKSIGQAGRRFVLAHHGWPDALDRFELIVTGETRRTHVREDLAPSPHVRTTQPRLAVTSDRA